MKRKNTAGIVGVNWVKAYKRWAAHIYIRGKKKHLGYFKTQDRAARARFTAEIWHKWYSCNVHTTATPYLDDVK